MIHTPQGELLLAAGKSILLADSGDPLLHVVLHNPQDRSLNIGQLLAEQGRIGYFKPWYNKMATIQATRAEQGADGKIYLRGQQATTLGAQSLTRAAKIDIFTPNGDTTVQGSMNADSSTTGEKLPCSVRASRC